MTSLRDWGLPWFCMSPLRAWIDDVIVFYYNDIPSGLMAEMRVYVTPSGFRSNDIYFLLK
jgi:hypothetical protein